jgi:pyruvate dehydrogenase E2 component (dihydrolipoamide acetyltransferase)
MAMVGIIPNPASGKDIRRLVGHGLLVSNNEKSNILRRILIALHSLRISNVWIMPDTFGIGKQAIESLNRHHPGAALGARLLDMDVTGTGYDSISAARILEQMQAGCIITLGGDGTVRLAAKGSGAVPILPVSTGTNNVLPQFIEGTLAGLSAGLLALQPIEKRHEMCYRSKVIEIWVNGTAVDHALVDAVAMSGEFTGSKAVWAPERLRQVAVTRSTPNSIGLSSILGLLHPVKASEPYGAVADIGKEVGCTTVLAPLGPGLMAEVDVKRVDRLKPGEPHPITHERPLLIALDGEREITLKAEDKAEFVLNPDGPWIVDVGKVLAAASEKHWLIKKAERREINMPVDVVMPKLGLNMSEGLLVEWLKKEGDTVQKGDPLFIVETEKVTTESVAQVNGILSQILVQQGVIVPVKTVVAVIQAEAESSITPVTTSNHESIQKQQLGLSENIVQQATNTVEKEKVPASPLAKRRAKELGIDLGSMKGTGPGGRITQEDVEKAKAPPQKLPLPILASPVAKRLAREHGIDLAVVLGSGPDGRIIQEDIQAAIKEKTSPEETSGPGSGVIAIEGIRAVIARKMQQSVSTTAQVTLQSEADVTALVGYREKAKKSDDRGRAVPSYNTILIWAVAQALREHPRFNAVQAGEAIHIQHKINVGLAVDTDEGLLVVVVKEADQKTIQDIQGELVTLVDRALSKSSLAEDLEGGTFTITNLGSYGIDGFTPIINPPEMAILGVGRFVEKLVIQDGKVRQSPMATFSLTFDHRLVDGAPAARFLQTIIAHLNQLT